MLRLILSTKYSLNLDQSDYWCAHCTYLFIDNWFKLTHSCALMLVNPLMLCYHSQAESLVCKTPQKVHRCEHDWMCVILRLTLTNILNHILGCFSNVKTCSCHISEVVEVSCLSRPLCLQCFKKKNIKKRKLSSKFFVLWWSAVL